MASHDELHRFVEAQEGVYAGALEELRRGRKLGHWMWFTFPQIAGLGRTSTAQFYSLADVDEAGAYLQHEILGPRLMDCTQAMLGWAGRKSAEAILGPVDAMKFRSSMTLFAAAGGERCFAAALDGFYSGKRDPLTLERL